VVGLGVALACGLVVSAGAGSGSILPVALAAIRLAPAAPIDEHVRAASNAVTSLTLPSDPLGAPTNLTLSGATQTQITLTWTDNSSAETGFEVERRTAETAFTRIATVGAGVTSITNSGLTPGTHYFYRVRAVDASSASDYSNEADASTLTAALIGFSLSPTLVQGGLPVSGKVTLDQAASAGGVLVTLTGDSALVATPASVTVPEGRTFAVFTAATSPVASRQQVKVTAALGGAGREAGAVLLPSPGDATPPRYWIRDLGLPPGDGHSQAWGINSAGQVVGGTAGTPPRDGGFLYDGQQIRYFGHNTVAYGVNAAGQAVGSSNGVAAVFDTAGIHALGTLPGTGISTGYGINAAGDVTGYASGNGYVRAFLYRGGVLQDLGALDNGASLAYGINASGQVAGFSGKSDHMHAFLYDSAGMHDLGTLGGQQSFAYAINDAGFVVGYSTLLGNNGGQPFLYDGTGLYDLGSLGNPFDGSEASGINTQGQVVGHGMSDGPDGFHAFLWQNGRMLDLNDLIPPGSGWVVVEAEAINDAGQIACVGLRDDGNPNGQNYALLLTPDAVASPPLPDNPSGLTAGAPSESGMELTWSDGGTLEYGYEIQRRVPGVDWQTIATVLPNTTRYQDTGLTAGTPYSYRIRSVNGAGGSAWSSEVGGTTTGGTPGVGISFSALSLPESLAFGDQTVGTPSTARQITLTNTGTAPLTISSVTLKGLQAAEFALVADSGEATAAPGATRTLTLCFTPAQVGGRSATLVIMDNAPGSPHSVELGGAGVAAGALPVTAHGIVVFRPSTCEWFFHADDQPAEIVQFGGSEDVPVPADYLGLGQPQVAVFRPGTREWFIRTADGGTIPVQFGGLGDVPVPGDYFGLGRAQIAVFRTTTQQWFLRRDDGQAVPLQFGGPGDLPVPGDYFGLGRASVAVFRPGTGEWFLRRDDGHTVPILWGTVGDVPLPGDYLGLGRAQVAVFRPSTREWFLRQDDGQAVKVEFGGPGDVPVPGDYFGLGRLSLGVYGPGAGTWFLRTDLGDTVPVPWGGPGDWPVGSWPVAWQLPLRP
jgi:probable HAF family extracellular repeat protein